ncbi:MAG: hypothetical protein ABSB49_08720 [Polyangia bacterium]
MAPPAPAPESLHPAPGQAAGPEPAATTATPPVAAATRSGPPVVLYTVFGFLCMGVALWLVFAWTGYKDRYSQHSEGWHLGATKMIEITLVRDDKKNLACASDRSFAGTHCGFHANIVPWGPGPDRDVNTLQPFNTVRNELFLASGLWFAQVLRDPLPSSRFTVVCNYHVTGVLKNVSLRWSPTGSFTPVDQSVAVGTLTDCVIPQ